MEAAAAGVSVRTLDRRHAADSLYALAELVDAAPNTGASKLATVRSWRLATDLWLAADAAARATARRRAAGRVPAGSTPDA